MRFMIIFLFAIFSIASFAQDFSNQVFLIHSDLDRNACQVTPECDCCTACLYVFNKTQFVYVSECISGDTFYKGTYIITDRSLRLTFHTKRVDERYPNDDVEETPTFLPQKSEITTMNFEIEKCSSGVLLKTQFNGNAFFGTRLDQEMSLLEKLKKSLGYQKLAKL